LFKNSKISSSFAIDRILNSKQEEQEKNLGDNSMYRNFKKGFDIVSQEYYDDMIEKGIIDSYNTIKCAIEDAISVASLIITTECIVYKEIDYDRKVFFFN